MFSYAIIFLGKLANEGLLHPDLTVIDAGSPPLPPAPMSPDDRLCRLFQLGADLLDAIAPTPHHPAVRQAAFLRKVLDAAISGRRSSASAPSSPSLAAASGQGTVPPLAPPALSHELPSAAARQHEQRRPQAHGPLPPVLAPATVPPPPAPPPQHAHHPSSVPADGFSSTIAANGSAAAALSAYSDFSLSTSYQPTPMHSPPPQQLQQLQAVHVHGGVGSGGSAAHLAPPPAVVAEDPFAALLSGVSPSMYDAGQSFFALDAGIDWSTLGGAHDAHGLGQGGYSLF